MKILAIETSCDETAAAITEFSNSQHTIKSNIIASQIELHQKYGGVVPELASRQHIENITYVVEKALEDAKESFQALDAIAVTYAPGLIGALLVGTNYAKSLASALAKPLIPIHHIEGHICANFIEHPDLQPPFLTLVASGGHSSIVLARSFTRFETIAKTRDDAAGEAFDKIARALKLGYPGGPAISRAARDGNPTAYHFPRVTLANSPDFSFSGVKTAVINEIHKAAQRQEAVNVPDIAASFQEAVCDVLATRLITVAKHLNIDKIALAGGVAANVLLREKLTDAAKNNGFRLYIPSPIYCTDNAAMIAVRAQYAPSPYPCTNSLNAIATLELPTFQQ